MKKLLLALCLFLLPGMASALTGNANITCNNTSLGANSSTSCTLYANITSGSAAGFGGTFSASNVTISNIAITSSFTGVGASAPVNGMILNVLPSSGDGKVTGNVAVATFTATVGSTRGTISFNGQMTDENYDDFNVSASKALTVLSSNANLASLSVTGGTLSPSFQSSTTSYTMSTDSSSVTISAAAEEGTVTGTGTVNLNYGPNTVNVTVTAPAGNQKIYTIKINRNDTRSSDNTLKSLTVSNASINFDPSVLNYDVQVASNVKSVQVSAQVNDSKATLSYAPAQTVSVLYGQTSIITVTVKAENGTTKAYKINITRKDDRSTNNNLKSLTVSNTNIGFNGGQSYTATVENSVTAITINAAADDSKAVVSGTGNKTLKEGSNSFVVSVKAENGSVKSYTITVIRKYAQGTQVTLSSNNNLKNLSISNVNLSFDKNTLAYNASVENSVTNVKVNYEVEDSKATATVVGGDNLKVGTNKVEVVVVAENGNSKTYTITVVRKDVRSNVKNNNDEIVKNLLDENVIPPIYVNVKETDENKEFTKEVADALIKSKKSMFYEVTNDSNGIVYTLYLDGNTFTSIDPFSYELLITSDDERISKIKQEPYVAAFFKQRVTLNSDVKIKIYIGDKANFTENQIAIYTYNTESGTYELLNNNLNYIDGYVEFETKTLDGFFFTKSENKVVTEEPKKEEGKFNIWLIIGPVLGVLVLLSYFANKKYQESNQ